MKIDEISVLEWNFFPIFAVYGYTFNPVQPLYVCVGLCQEFKI